MLGKLWFASAALLSAALSGCIGGAGDEGDELLSPPPDRVAPDRGGKEARAEDRLRDLGAEAAELPGALGQRGDARALLLVASEVEPNGSIAEASGPYTEDVSVHAAISPAADQDFFSFTLATTKSVIIETHGVDGPNTCPAGADTLIELIGPDGTSVLAADDDDGATLCSIIQPTTDAGARQLAPGTYYVLCTSARVPGQ